MFPGESHPYSVSDIEEVDSQKLSKRIKYRRKLFNDLRQRFRKEYLSDLIQKFNEKSSREPKVGEIVLIGEDNKKRLFWPMARIIELIPGRDGKIRTVKLKTQHGIVLRPVQRVYPLEIRANENCVTEKIAGEGESNSKKGVNVTIAPNDVIKKYTSSDSDSNHILKNYSEAPTKANNAKKNKKRKINKKDSVEDFVFPKKTARPVSPLPSEPVTVNNSFSDLESENDKDQVAPEENNETAPQKPKPPPPIHLKIKKNIRNQLKSIYQKFPDITNKSSREFIKLITNVIEEYHDLTNFLEEDKDFEFFSLKPKPIKPIKIVIKGLPIFTKTHEIQSDLEEEGFTIENVSQLISKKTKIALPFFQVTLPLPQRQ
ncbi:uncharacterized protein TNCV_131851 [Trichonephila clavipes]|nr:uncharacterized protein TNCV_131851 [Trichonephila clavipes]